MGKALALGGLFDVLMWQAKNLKIFYAKALVCDILHTQIFLTNMTLTQK